MAFRTGRPSGVDTQLLWFDRQGKQLGQVGPPAHYDDVQLSPDGKLVLIAQDLQHLWVADSARTVIVGTPAPADLRIVRSTEEALAAGIAAAQPGNRLGDISAAIGAVAHDYGYPVNTEFGGHGLGRTMHESPHVPNKGRAGRGLRLQPGLTIALEPWWARTTDRIVYDPDGWTIRSADGSRTAHSEHTVAITADGPLVLSRLG